jgi:hypothetical protein
MHPPYSKVKVDEFCVPKSGLATACRNGYNAGKLFQGQRLCDTVRFWFRHIWSMKAHNGRERSDRGNRGHPNRDVASRQ